MYASITVDNACSALTSLFHICGGAMGSWGYSQFHHFFMDTHFKFSLYNLGRKA